MSRGQAHSTDFVSDKPIGIDFSALSIQSLAGGVVTGISEREFAETEGMMKFMAEPVDIEIHTSPDQNAPPVVMVGVNGQTVWLPRGRRVNNIPRSFVEVLARSQSTAYKTNQVRDPSADEQMRVTRRTSQDYGFSVVRDANPKGRAWLERVTREGS